MTPPTTATRQRWTQLVLHTHDTPRRTAAALALGVAIGFSPLLGLHVVIGAALAFILNLNRVAVLVGVFANLPWLIGPYYAGATALGAWLTNTPMPEHLLSQLRGLSDLPSWSDRIGALTDLVQPLLVPFSVGSTLCAVVLSVAVYLIAKPVLESRAAFASRHGGDDPNSVQGHK